MIDKIYFFHKYINVTINVYFYAIKNQVLITNLSVFLETCRLKTLFKKLEYTFFISVK